MRPDLTASRDIERQIAWLLLTVNTLPRLNLKELERSLAELGIQVETMRSNVAAIVEKQSTDKSIRKQKANR